MLVTIVAGARPNFVKIGPIVKALNQHPEKQNLTYRLVHTGQHYDKEMSGDFFEQLGLPEPHVNLMAGGGSQAEQTGTVMINFEKYLISNPTDFVLVVGDVNSTMACAITAKKLCIPVVHVEAGIRSGDMTMPEEVNRVVTDSISDHFFTTTEGASAHLLNTGISQDRIHFVGNTMIDTLLQNLDKAKKPTLWAAKNLTSGNYYVTTFHRPSNVDDKNNLKRILDVILANTDLPIVFPVHPRTKKVISAIPYEHPRLFSNTQN